MSAGLFVVLEALDGVGKTTLARDLAQRVGGVSMDTPGPELRVVSPAVLAGLGADQDARCLFYAASVLALGRRARGLADAGTVVVMDRYWLSTVSYARTRGASVALDAVERSVPEPDITVLLTLDEDERQRRLHSRGFTAADRETLSPRFRAPVLQEMMSDARLPALRPTVTVDLTDADPEHAVLRVIEAIGVERLRRRRAH